MVLRANSVNSKRFDAKASDAIGIDLKGALLGGSQDIRDQLEISRQYNASLIKSLTTDFQQRISSTIMNIVQSGERSTNIITQIMGEFGITERHAKFIARDQTSKINGDLSKIRAESLGSKTYTWSGSMDERERDSHRSMQGKLCRWDDPTVYSDDDGKTWKSRRSIGGVLLHPSQDYNCRCIALAVVSFD